MPKQKCTAVNLTNKAMAIKNRLAPALQLKGILSVGLELFDALPADEKIRRVAEAMAEDEMEKADPKIALDQFKSILDTALTSGGQIYKMLSGPEQELLNELREKLGPPREKADSQGIKQAKKLGGK